MGRTPQGVPQAQKHCSWGRGGRHGGREREMVVEAEVVGVVVVQLAALEGS